MKFLLPILSLLGLETQVLIEQARRNAIVTGTMAFFALAGLIFTLVAAHAALAAWLGPIWAPVILAGAAFAGLLVTYLVRRLTERAAQRRRAEQRYSSETRALMTTTAITAVPMLLKSPLLRRYGLPIGAALVAYFVLSRGAPESDDDDEA